MLARGAMLLAAAILAAAAPASAEDCTTAVGYRVMHIGRRVVAAWYPTSAQPAEHSYGPNFSGLVALDAPPSPACGKPVPLVVFSHGDFGCGLQSVAFTEELARHGYVVAAPDHADAALCHTVPPSPGASRPPPQSNVFKPETWSEATFADRRADIAAVLDALLSDAEFKTIIDEHRIGAAGHSLGGYTMVGMAGGWPSWLEPRIRAVLAFSPYVLPFQVRATLGGVRVPLMYQGGTLDIGITPFLKGSNGAFAQANPPVYWVELKDAGHLAWVNCGNAHTTASCLETKVNMRLIDRYGIAFFDEYLKQQRSAILAGSDPSLAGYQVRLPNQ
jgi:predicted dienelactone hydrolase